LTAEIAEYKKRLTRLKNEHDISKTDNQRLAAEMNLMRFDSEQTLVATTILNRDLQNELSVMKEELENVRRE
jgi:hypothetical protein